MKALRQFALIAAILLPLLTPAIACAIPGAKMTAAERACCKQMKSQCGNMEMPASHGCCEKDLPTASHWNAAQLPSAHAYAGLGAATDLPVIAVLQNPASLPGFAPLQSYTLPHSPPAAISILRI